MQSMSYKEWLHAELIGDDEISEETDVDEISRDFLLTQTDVDESDLEDYHGQFINACEINGWEPVEDLPEV